MGLLSADLNYSPPQKKVIFDFYDIPMQEAKEYYDWYISSIDERSDYLRRVVAEQLSISITDGNH